MSIPQFFARHHFVQRWLNQAMFLAERFTKPRPPG
jgi:hypothetical protein